MEMKFPFVVLVVELSVFGEGGIIVHAAVSAVFHC